LATDKGILRELERSGAVGPPTKLVRARGRTLEEATKVAAMRARIWGHEGYDVAGVLISLTLNRCDAFFEAPLELRLSPRGELHEAGGRGRRRAGK
jgi:hypothetical protein